MKADVSDLAATRRVVEATVERFGNLDIIFTNAGTGCPTNGGRGRG
jgi:NAD(P)-dependent dehydrogenase (short-subunit alcohol dehydrogenase family)